MKTIHLRAGLLPCALIIGGVGTWLATGISYAQEADAAEQSLPVDTADVADPGEHRGHHREMMKNMKKHRGKEMDGRLLKLDTNNDGKVDLNEFLSHSEQRFHEMDINDDQFVTPDEARQKHQMMRQEHKKMREKMHEGHRDAPKADGATESTAD